jgi:hypothetical protein
MAARAKFGIPQNRFVIFDAAALKLTHKRIDWLAKEVAIARQKVDVHAGGRGGGHTDSLHGPGDVPAVRRDVHDVERANAIEVIEKDIIKLMSACEGGS